MDMVSTLIWSPLLFGKERAANTTIRLGWARIGYMDGTITREVCRDGDW